MKILLSILFAFLIAFPAAAVGEGFDKAWAEASPGWYVRMKYSRTYIDGSHPEIFPVRYWIVAEETNESLALVSTDIDQRSKPIFRKMLTTLWNSVKGCADNKLIFQVKGEDIEILPTNGIRFSPEIAPPPKYWFAGCEKIIHWQLVRKSCGDENFLACIADKFSKKFPLDILFNLPSAQITCPQVNFFGSEFDLCFIYEALRLMKYPIAAALVVKVFLYL